jgi:hypothetical protein
MKSAKVMAISPPVTPAKAGVHESCAERGIEMTGFRLSPE